MLIIMFRAAADALPLSSMIGHTGIRHSHRGRTDPLMMVQMS